MTPRRFGPFLLLIISACSTDAQALRRHPEPAQPVGVFVNGSDRITLDLGRALIEVDGQSRALENCSTDTFNCYRNVALGFHIEFPRSCRTVAQNLGSVIGGHHFYVFRMMPHSDIRDGSYVSDLSHRFSYGYMVKRGLFEIRYDKLGKILFGPGDNGASLNTSEAEPYTYSLKSKRPFLRCHK